MAFLPLIERELRVALRKKRPVKNRWLVAAACSGGALLFLATSTLSGSRGMGGTLHKALCVVGVYLALRTPLLMAGVFTEERRNQTLGLLFLSGLRAGEIFVSKVFSAAMIAFTGLLAMFPLLALPFLTGGVSFDLFVATIFALPNLLVFALAVTLLASVLTEDEGAAVLLAGALAAVVCAAPAMVYLGQAHFAPGTVPSCWWLRLSPAYGPWLIWKGLGWGAAAEFWRNAGMTMCWSALCLLAADVALRRVWRDWRENRGVTGWNGGWQHILHGNVRDRQRLAARWLEVNPWVWLAARDRRPATLGWWGVGGLAFVWVAGCVVWRGEWLRTSNLLLTAALLNFVLHWIIRYTAAEGLGNGRRDGSYELLLTTPLNPSEIVQGELEALRWHFGGVTQAALGMNAGLMLAGLAARSWTPRALFVYGAIWSGMLTWAWVQARNWRAALPAMWAGLNCGRPAQAIWRVAGLNSRWRWFTILFNLGFWSWTLFVSGIFSSALSRFPSGSSYEIQVALTVAFFAVCVVVAEGIMHRSKSVKDGVVGHTLGNPMQKQCGRRLVAEFREIVREPVPDPDDPRFKKWHCRERFPWGWEIVEREFGKDKVVRRSERIRLAALTKSLLRAERVWEFCGNNWKGKRLVRPVKELPIADAANCLLGCELTLADGTKVYGHITNLSLTSSEENQHFLTLSVFAGGEAVRLARYHDADFAERGPGALARKLGKREDEVFPISFDMSEIAVGAPGCVRGRILKEPQQKLSREQLLGRRAPRATLTKGGDLLREERCSPVANVLLVDRPLAQGPAVGGETPAIGSDEDQGATKP